jgi:hypothetical protein
MGASGHAFVAHTKALSPAAQTKDGGYGLPPHPLVIRLGQRYWPRRGKYRRPFVVRRLEGDHAVGKRTDNGLTVRVSVARLLESRDDGQGRDYQFEGFAPRRYLTRACVCEFDGEEIVLCIPEWHPRRPVRLLARLVPVDAHAAGAWLELRCDLSATSAARLNPSDLALSSDPGETMHPPAAMPNAGARISKID